MNDYFLIIPFWNIFIDAEKYPCSLLHIIMIGAILGEVDVKLFII